MFPEELEIVNVGNTMGSEADESLCAVTEAFCELPNTATTGGNRTTYVAMTHKSSSVCLTDLHSHISEVQTVLCEYHLCPCG